MKKFKTFQKKGEKLKKDLLQKKGKVRKAKNKTRGIKKKKEEGPGFIKKTGRVRKRVGKESPFLLYKNQKITRGGKVDLQVGVATPQYSEGGRERPKTNKEMGGGMW